MKRHNYFAIAIVTALALSVTSFFTGCSKKEASVRPQASPTPTEEIPDFHEDSASNLGHWGRAMGSVLLYINDGNPYYFGGYEENENNKKGAIDVLSASWNINSRKDLLKQIKKLLDTGDRAAFLEEAKDMAAMPPKKLKTALKQLSGELLIHYKEVKYNWKVWGKRGLLAWDMCRISHLAQWGHIADYITLEEAQALIEPAAVKLKKQFDSWDDVQQNWLDGFCLYAAIDRKLNGNEYINRKTIYEKLKKDQPQNGALYDDALFQEKIIPLSSVSYRTILDEVAKKKPKKKKKGKDKKTQDTTAEASPSPEV